jgi:hypothetical protein
MCDNLSSLRHNHDVTNQGATRSVNMDDS